MYSQKTNVTVYDSDTTRHDTARHGTARHDTTRHGLLRL